MTLRVSGYVRVGAGGPLARVQRHRLDGRRADRESYVSCILIQLPATRGTDTIHGAGLAIRRRLPARSRLPALPAGRWRLDQRPCFRAAALRDARRRRRRGRSVAQRLGTRLCARAGHQRPALPELVLDRLLEHCRRGAAGRNGGLRATTRPAGCLAPASSSPSTRRHGAADHAARRKRHCDGACASTAARGG